MHVKSCLWIHFVVIANRVEYYIGNLCLTFCFTTKNDSARKTFSNTAVAPSDHNRKWSVIRRHRLAALAPSSPCVAAVYFCGRICVIWWLQAGVRLSVSGVGVVYLSMFRSLFSTVLWRLARPAAAALESGCCSCGESSRMLFFCFIAAASVHYLIFVSHQCQQG